MNEAIAAGGGIVFLVVSIFSIVLAIFWLVLPFIIIGQLGAIRRAVEQLDLTTRTEAAKTRVFGETVTRHVADLASRSEHTNSLLTWIGEQQQQPRAVETTEETAA